MCEKEQTVTVTVASIAALAMSQIGLLKLVEIGLLSKDEAGVVLRQLAEPHLGGGPASQAAATILMQLAESLAG
ncbi:hypothetical protein [Bradyrhizobium centrolobii]|nr:hypothetical protein [Bradyrhizobium centrolobii]